MRDEEDDWREVGHRLRAAREGAGLSIRELARRVDVSPSHVSQVERGLSSFSVATLYAVASLVNVSLDSLFEKSDRPDPREGLAPSPLEGENVLRAHERSSLKLRSGPRWERLTPRSNRDFEFLEVIYEPRAADIDELEFSRHDGRECGVVISGQLTVEVGFERTTLFAGDSIQLDSSIPHRFWNSGTSQTRAIWMELRSGD